MSNLSTLAALGYTHTHQNCESHVQKDEYLFWLTQGLILSDCFFTLDELQSRGTTVILISSAIRWLNLNMKFNNSAAPGCCNSLVIYTRDWPVIALRGVDNIDIYDLCITVLYFFYSLWLVFIYFCIICSLHALSCKWFLQPIIPLWQTV